MSSPPPPIAVHPLAVRPPPLVKWPGGKGGEVDRIHRVMPHSIGRYYEPFVGGGALWFSLPSQLPALVNDMSEDLVAFYRAVATGSHAFREALQTLLHNADLCGQIADAYGGDMVRQWRRFENAGATLEQVGEWLVELADVQSDLMGHLSGKTRQERERELWRRELREGIADKLKRMAKLPQQPSGMKAEDIVGNMETALRSAWYMTVRELHNHPGEYGVPPARTPALFWYVRENAYASMFRSNARGEFNVPYGGMSYNRKDLAAKVATLQNLSVTRRLSTSTLGCEDFEKFLLRYPPGREDFVFLDPPYDSTFSTYDGNSFGEAEHRRLAAWILLECQARCLLVIQDSPLVRELYTARPAVRDGKPLRSTAFDKTYQWTIKERNQRETSLLMLANYDPAECRP